MKLLSRIFSKLTNNYKGANGDRKENTATNLTATDAIDPEATIDIVGFVDHVVRLLVDNPEDVALDTSTNDRGLVVKVSCRKCDIRKIIGKNGRTINSIRSLAKGAAKRSRKNVEIIVLD